MSWWVAPALTAPLQKTQLLLQAGELSLQVGPRGFPAPTHILVVNLSEQSQFHTLPLPAGHAAECGNDNTEGGTGPAARHC